MTVTRNGICLILVAFVFSFLASALSAATKTEIYELSQKIKQKQAKITTLYAELRKLNEEGGPEAQEKAQIIMEQIKALREEVTILKKNLNQIKSTAGSGHPALEASER